MTTTMRRSRPDSGRGKARPAWGRGGEPAAPPRVLSQTSSVRNRTQQPSCGCPIRGAPGTVEEGWALAETPGGLGKAGCKTRVRAAARTIAAGPASDLDHAQLTDALRTCREDGITAIYRGDRPSPAHLTIELGELPRPGPARATRAALALRIEERLDAQAPEQEHEQTPAEQQLRRLEQLTHVPPAKLTDAANQVPVGDLGDAGPRSWSIVLDHATQHHHDQARVLERSHGLSLCRSLRPTPSRFTEWPSRFGDSLAKRHPTAFRGEALCRYGPERARRRRLEWPSSRPIGRDEGSGQ
jgi:hypothetical protein